MNMKLSLGSLALAGLLAGGCAQPSAPPATQPSAAAPMTPAAPMAMTGPAPTMVTPPAAKDLTHVLTMDEPYFASEPADGAVPSGTLKSGAKVLVLIPGAKYTQVVTDTGISAYTVTDGLKPLGK